MELKYISIFSGIEAASVAWGPLGFKPVAFSEIEPFPCAVLEHYYPDVPNLGDITQVDWRKYHGKCDIIIGGSPCQSFSIAGRREGLAGESGLMFEYVRCVREVRPRWFVWENVPGALSIERGKAFRQLLSEMDKLGYGVSWRVFDSQFFGVAQRRRRVFVVGSLGDMRSADVLFEPDCLCEDNQSSREKRQELTRTVGYSASHHLRGDDEGGLSEYACIAFAQNTRSEVRIFQGDGDVAGTVAANPDFNKGQGASLIMQPAISIKTANVKSNGSPYYIVRRLTPVEFERLQGFSDGYTDIPYRGKEHPPDTTRYKALGNSFCVPVVRWIGERIKVVESEGTA